MVRQMFMVLVLAGCAVACDSDPQQSEDAVLSEVTDASSEVSNPSDRACGLLECASDQACCDFACTSIASDPQHCGGCGIACDPTETCQESVCRCGQPACGAGDVCCDVSGELLCVATDGNPNHCGGCGITCDAGERCLDGACACQAADGVFEGCSNDENCCPGLGCRKLDTDELSCGACGVVCGAGELCDGGACTCGTTSSTGAPACTKDESCCGDPAQCQPREDPICQCGSSVCASGQICCDAEGGAEECVRPSSDPAHCGACGATCAAGQICSGGVCECQEGFADCDGDASNGCESRLDLDIANCGGCGNACAPGELCSQSQCVLNCQRGLTRCGEGCFNLGGDTQNCGACGASCGGGQLCDGLGTCATTCVVGMTECADGCFSLLSDRGNCGGCAVACSSGKVCDGHGQCRTTCQPGLSSCSGSCYNIDASLRHCGACHQACPSGQVCNGAGICELSCLAGLTDCGGDCVDLATEFGHCGACGNDCRPGEQCIQGACQPVCPRGQLGCDGLCIDPLFDPDHCGACGRACGVGSYCLEGVCRCGVGTSACTGGCFDLTASPDHCGACDNACANGTFCINGTCQALGGCPTPLVDCGGACTDTQTHVFHCGACDNSCSTGQACVGGVCTCPEGYGDCVGSDGICETSIYADTSNCGACGNVCEEGQRCDLGSCVCDFDRLDCNANPGCETLQDDTNCGTCGNACTAFELCTGDACRPRARPVAANLRTSLVIDSNGALYGFGSDFHSLLGTPEEGRDHDVPLQVPGFDGSTPTLSVDMGEQHACAVLASGETRCWGVGSLGCGTTACEGATSVQVGDIDGVTASAVQVAVGDGAVSSALSCALLDTGAVICWGANAAGQLGGSDLSTLTPVTGIDGVAASAVQIAVGLSHACALLDTGAMRCWGAGTNGQLGQGATTSASTPVQPTGLDGVAATVRSIAATEANTCAVLTTGEVRCWGQNNVASDPLSVGTIGSISEPMKVLGLEGQQVLNVFADDMIFCAITRTRDTWCWGSSSSAHPFGLNSGSIYTTAPFPLTLKNVTHFAAYTHHALATTSDGKVYGWGLNTNSQLAAPHNQQSSYEPVVLPNITAPDAYTLSEAGCRQRRDALDSGHPRAALTCGLRIGLPHGRDVSEAESWA